MKLVNRVKKRAVLVLGAVSALLLGTNCSIAASGTPTDSELLELLKQKASSVDCLDVGSVSSVTKPPPR